MFKRSTTAALCGLLTSLLFLPTLALGQTGSGNNFKLPPRIAAFVEEHVKLADELRKAHKGKEALAEITEAIRIDPTCGKCFGLRSGIYGDLQQYREGLADGFSGIHGVTTPRDRAMATYNKGFNLGGLGRSGEALEAYNDSIHYDPTYALAYFGKGKALHAQRDWSESKEALEKALDLNPKHGPSWAYLAEDQNFLGEPDAGLYAATKAIEFAPTDPRSFRALAFAHAGIGDFAATLTDAARTLELDPERPLAHLLRAYALRGLNRHDEAAKELALEPDRKAVAYGFPYQIPDLRIYNCGDTSTEIQTASNYNVDGFADCLKRVDAVLDEVLKDLEAPPIPKRSIPGLPNRLPVKK